MFWMAGFYVNSLFCPSGFNMYLSLTLFVHHTLYYLLLIGTPPSKRSSSDDCSGYDCQRVVPLIQSRNVLIQCYFFLHSSCLIKQIQPQRAFFFIILETVFAKQNCLVRHFFASPCILCQSVFIFLWQHIQTRIILSVCFSWTELIHECIHFALVSKLSNRCFCVDLLPAVSIPGLLHAVTTT